MTRLNAWRRELATPLTALHDELNRVLAHYRPAPGATEPEGGWCPALDLVETPDEVLLWADLPGVDPGSIDLTVTGRVLTLRGRKAPEVAPAEAREHARERPAGPFEREVTLPSDVDVEAVEADARDGVLRVRLPKTDTDRPRSIPVKTG